MAVCSLAFGVNAARTFVTACEVLNLGVSEGRAFELLSTIWNPACLPPWDEDEYDDDDEDS